ncbi:MAG: TRAP transporter small permease [Rhizobiaceae bacterium]
MRPLALKLDRLSLALHNIALWGAVLAVVFMLGAACWQVVARYILAQPPAWTEELARFSMVWAGLLGASCAFRLRSDPSLFPQMLDRSGGTGRLLALVRLAGVLIFIFPILWYSFFGPGMNPERGYIARLAGRSAETLDVPMTVFGLAIPVAFTLIFIHLIAQFALSMTEPNTEDKT